MGANKDEVLPVFFYTAQVKGYPEAISQLKASGEVNKLTGGYTLIYLAVLSGKIKDIYALKEAGADVDKPVEGGYTPLFAAVQLGKQECVVALLEVGADVSIKVQGVCTVLDTARSEVIDGGKEASPKIIELLEEAYLKKMLTLQESKQNKEGQRVQTVRYITQDQLKDFFKNANASGYVYALHVLQTLGANVNTTMPDGRTLLYIAVENSNRLGVEALRNAGANIDVAISNGMTPIYIAAVAGSEEMIRMLKGANVNIRSFRNTTPLHMAIAGGHTDAVEALLEIGADITLKTQGCSPLEWARKATKIDTRPIVKLLETHAEKLKPIEEKRKKAEALEVAKNEARQEAAAKQREIDERKLKQKQEKAARQEEIRKRMAVRREFFDLLQVKFNLLCVKNQEIKTLAEQRKGCRADIFVNIGALTDILEKTLEGNANNNRLSLLVKNSIHLDKACDLNDKIKAQGKKVQEALKDFEELSKGLKGELLESEKIILATRCDWFSKTCEALMGEANDSNNAVLSSVLPCLQKEWDLVEEKFKVLLDFAGQLSNVNDMLTTQIETVKFYRVLNENVTVAKKEKFNKKMLTSDDLKKIKDTVTIIRNKITAQHEADAIASQVAQERARQLKKTMALRSVPKSTGDSSSTTVSLEHSRRGGMDLTVGTGELPNITASISHSDTGVPRHKRRTPARIAYELKQIDEERKTQEEIRCFYLQEAVGNIANGLFSRPLPRDEEVKERVEHSDLLIEELGILQSVVDLLESDTEWTPEMRYALWGSFARVNEVIGQECRDGNIVKIAKGLRNVIFKYYETIQTKMYSDIQCLGIVKAWIQFYEKPKIGMFVTEKGVLAEVNSPLLSSFYEDTSALTREMDTVDFPKYRACLSEMQHYFESRNKEDGNVIAYAANLLFLGVTGAKFKALRVMSKDKPEAVLVMKAFDVLNTYASEIIARGADARHPRKVPMLYLRSLGVRQEINPAYEYEDNDMQAILVSRLRYLRETNPSEDTVLGSIRVLAAVDNIGFRQLATRLEEDKKLNGDMGVRSVLIPCNLGNAHWVGVYLQFNTSGQVVQALYMDSLRQNTTIPLTLQKQLQAVYPRAAFERRALMMQEDSTSCGAYAIENLLLCAQNLPVNTSDARAIRQLHLQALEKYRPDFYPAFYERQRTNTPTIASLEKQLGYVDKLKKVVFSKQELHRILCIKSCLSRLSAKSEIALLKVFRDQSATDEPIVHLTLIRSVLEENLRSADVFELAQNKALAELLELLCGIKDWLPGTVLPQSLDFKVGYEEILAIANVACTPEQVVSTQQNVMQQIEWDKQFALQLQVEFSNKVGALKNKGIVS